MSDRGRFITFEGGEGAGKTTQIKALAAHLRERGIDPVLTREPGGSPGAEAIRELLLSGAVKWLGPTAEAAMFYAARDDHLEQTIRPALEAGRWVLCDRFSDSTRAYQGASGGVAEPVLRAMERVVVAETRPDLTLILDLPPTEGLRRAKERGQALDRFEGEAMSFHERLREAFLRLAALDPERCIVVDANRPMEAVENDVWAAVHERFDLAQAAVR